MAQTKVKLISDGVIVQGNLHASHGITTAHIGEGSNLYYTDARVGSYLSSNGYATQSTIVAAITDSAPSTLDTLNELAAALGDDVNFSTTVTNSIATKMPLAGGTFTGNVTANGIYSTGQSAIIYKAQRNGGAVASDWSYDDATTDISLGTSTSHSFSLKTGNTRALTINSSQNVGIGTTSPNYRLEVRTTNNNRAIQAVNSTTSGTNWGFQGGAFGSGATKNIGLQVTAEGASTNYAALFDGGNVGIGTTSPSARLNVSGIGQANNPTVAIDVTNSDSFNHGVEIFDGNLTTGETVLMAIGHSGSTKLTAIFGFIRNENSLDQNLATIGFWGADNKLTVAAGGNVGIGTGVGVPGYKLDVQGTIRATGDVIAYSDARVKDNVKTIDNALDKVTKLRGVSYNRKDIEDKSTKIGVIAQEVKDILPEVVEQDMDNKYSVAYGNMAGVFIEAIKELKAEIEELKKQVKK